VKEQAKIGKIMNAGKFTFVLLGISLAALSMAMLSMLAGYLGIMLNGGLFRDASPLGVIVVFAIIILGGVYLFNTAAKIIKNAINTR